MPAQKVANVEEFFARLGSVERAHLETLRELSLKAAKSGGCVEELKWNFPAYTKSADGKAKPVMVWTLQCFKHHCSIRFPVVFFGAYRAEALAAGLDAIEGAIKFTWDQKIPAQFVAKLIKERIKDFDAGNTAWS